MAAKTSNKAVAKKEEEAGAVALLDELTAGADDREVMGKDDMSIPFLAILQSLSPQCTKGEADYIKEAEPSMLFNTVTKRMYPTFDDDDNKLVGTHIISVHYKASYVEWVPRAQGGGFAGEYDVALGSTAITEKNDNNQDIIQQGSPIGTPGNQLSYTHTHFVFVVDKETGRFKPAIISGSSTQVKPLKDLNGLIYDLETPEGKPTKRYYGLWAVSTKRRTNDSGTWYIWDFHCAGTVLDLGNTVAAEIIGQAKSLADGAKSGEVQPDRIKEAAVSENPSTGEAAGEGTTGEVPF